MKTRLLPCALACLLSLAPTSLAAPGDLDPTFGTVGKVVTPIDGGGFGSSVAVQGDGKIVVAGTSSNGFNNDFALMRYHANGTLDSSFGQGGKVITTIGTADEHGRSVAIQGDGKIVVVGNSYTGSKSNFAVVRYTATGELDTTFNSTGKVITAIGSGNDLARGVAIQSDGKIVVAGETQNGSYTDFAVVRYTATGALDATFNTTGKVITPIGSANDLSSCLAIQSDGKIVAAGWASNGSNSDFALVRYTATGALDTSFGTAGTGKVTTAIGSNDDLGNSIALQPDGRIVVAGTSFNS